MHKYGKFAILMAIIVGSLLWLATAGISGSQTYYKTISEAAADGRRRADPARPRGRRRQSEFDRPRRPASYSSIWCRTS